MIQLILVVVAFIVWIYLQSQGWGFITAAVVCFVGYWIALGILMMSVDAFARSRDR